MGKAKQNQEVDDPQDDQHLVAPAAPNDASYDDYIADMILELQQMAARSGRHALAERLLAAHELARHR